MSRVLAVDPGSKRVGLALSDQDRILATPLPALPAQPLSSLPGRLASLAAEKGATLILIGWPRHLDGREGASARAARELAQQVREKSGLEVRLVDERLTTVAASRALQQSGQNTRKQKEKIDSAAACVLLQGWLDGEASRAAGEGTNGS